MKAIMDIQIDRNSRIPLYLQIQENLKKLLAEDKLKRGMQLPTERELSIQLNVSRNTVSMAYNELAQQKIISSISGKGTFIIADRCQPKTFFTEKSNSLLIKHIDLAIKKAFEMNIYGEDLLHLFRQRLEKNRHLLDQVRIAFIECNQEQLFYFSKKLELGTGIHILPILIDEMMHQPEEFMAKARSVDLVVTTFFHFQEVEQFLKGEDKKIIAVALDPQIETMVNIARATTPETRIGLVCLTSEFAERVFKSIIQAGIKYKSIAYTTTHDSEELQEFIHEKEVLIVSPGRKKDIRKFISNSIQLIEFIYIPDKGSIDTLKKTIFDIKKER